MNKIKIEFYKDKKGEHRWRMKRSGRIVADSAEGYIRPSGAAKALASLVKAISRGHYEIISR